MKKWTDVYIGLGSNAGNRRRNLLRAEEELKKNARVRFEKSSRIYETSPLGPKQRNFYNSVIKIRAALSPIDLMSFFKKIEQKLGRKKTFLWGPRTIDLDIIFYGSRKIRSEALTIPHPEFQGRKFVLRPLCDVAPRLVPAGFEKTVSKLLAELTDPNQRVRLVRPGICIRSRHSTNDAGLFSPQKARP